MPLALTGEDVDETFDCYEYEDDSCLKEISPLVNLPAKAGVATSQTFDAQSPSVFMGRSGAGSSEESMPSYVFNPSSFQRFIPIQKWQGVVFEVGKETFFAYLYDLTDKENPTEEAEFPISDLSADDVAFLGDGARFYLNMGYSVSSRGQKQRTSIIRMQRVSSWTADEILDARTVAEAKLSLMDID